MGIPALSTVVGIPALSTVVGIPPFITWVGIPPFITWVGIPALSHCWVFPLCHTVGYSLSRFVTTVGIPSPSTVLPGMGKRRISVAHTALGHAGCATVIVMLTPRLLGPVPHNVDKC